MRPERWGHSGTDSRLPHPETNRAVSFRAAEDDGRGALRRAPARGQGKGEVTVRVSLKGRNPFAFLFVTSRREQYLAQYVLREHTQWARLLGRPEVVATIGQRIVADLRLALAEPFVASSREGQTARTLRRQESR